MEYQIDLVELTKRRLKRLHGVKKLGQNAMETIIRSMNPKATLDATNHLATYLPPELCDKIFQYLLVKLEQIPEENQREYLEKIDFLLTEKTKFLDLGDVFPKRKSFTVRYCDPIDEDELELVRWFIDKVLNQAPSIVYIVFNNIRLFLYNNKHMEFIDGLTNFKQLKKLEMIRIDLDTPRVLNLCKNLPQLQILEINSFDGRYSDVESEEKIRQSLGNLRLLVGHTDERRKREIQQQFPHLNIVSFFQDAFVTTFRPVKHEDFLVDEIRLPPQRKYFSCGEDWFDSPDMYIHIKHPDVTYLEINFQFANEIPHTTPELPKFSKLKTLIARNWTDGTIIANCLRIYGHGLRSLWLQTRCYNHDFNVRVLELCPNLETILLNCNNLDDTSIQVENFPLLEELYLICARTGNANFLPKILSSPRLRKFEITSDFHNIADLVELNTMVSESQILQELESIKISTTCLLPDAFKQLLVFLENVSAFLPKLKDMRFDYSGREYVNLAKFLKRHHEIAYFGVIRNIILRNETLVPILESFCKLRI